MLAFDEKASYWNWDDLDDRMVLHATPKHFISANAERPHARQVILDEIHKNARWKQWLKGLYDKHHRDMKIIVTGSARLDVYRKGGDSLLGRYYLYRHHPLSLGELASPDLFAGPFKKPSRDLDAWRALERFGGFPAPLVAASEANHRKWLRMRKELLLRNDLRDLSQVQDIAAIERLTALIEENPSGLLNMNHLARNLLVSVDSVRRWIALLESIYYLFLVRPYTGRLSRSLQKMPKAYLWDWSACGNDGSRFENMIACHLLKTVHYWNDRGLGDYELFYLRDREHREVDFLIVKDKKPWLMVECKKRSEALSKSLYYFRERLEPAYTYQVIGDRLAEGKVLRPNTAPEIISAVDFCSQLA